MTELLFNSRRSPVLGMKGIVATSQPLAAQAGLDILSKGGNAADAAVATAAALAVTEPTSTGIGGDCFALHFQAKTRQITSLNASGRAPGKLNLELLANQGLHAQLPPFHAHTVTVPGACAGWCDLIARHGSMSLEHVLAAAIHLAQEGFPVAPITAYFWQRGVERQLGTAPGGLELTINGHAPKAGEIFRNPCLARTLQTVAQAGSDAFYEGEIGEAIVATLKAAGGVMELEDLASHQSTWDDPICTNYNGIRIWECPPNGQGIVALIALNILENFDLDSQTPLSPERIHLIIESLRLAFADAQETIADPEFHSMALHELLSKEYAKQKSKQIRLWQANPHPKSAHFSSPSDTVYLSVVDRHGNACSLINSNYMGFGTGIVPSGWGFSLQNRGLGFSLDPSHPNALAPGKRPYHTIIPGLATREDHSLYACFGVMGGFMQPQGHVQVILGLVQDCLDPQAALDRPRVCLQGGNPEGEVALEEGIPSETMEQLIAWGHRVELVRGYARSLFGRGQVIYRDPMTAVLWGGSDPRADGCALALL
jgi:gamma-glutamyltranspeptidase/glutathione hydrolase